MPKSYLSGAAKRNAREERAKQMAKMMKMSAFLKRADSAAADEAHTKNHLRSTMSEEQLSDLTMLSIENKYARKLEISNLMNIFAQENARKRFN